MPESGLIEVQTAAKVMNLMQDRIRRFVEDRTALAAAIAHDLGTPITRLHLRAHEIEDHAVRERLLLDLDQMRRMISATLEFARLEYSAEATEEMDLTSLVQSLCDEYCDDGNDIATKDLANVTISSKPVALRRALAKLMENAVKYGETAVVSMVVAQDKVRIEIRDHGPGIPDHLIEEVT